VKLVFSSGAWQDYLHWQGHDPAVLARLNALIEESRRTPFHGTGKPEPLRRDLQGWCSHRITLEDRLVYRVAGTGEDQRLEILQCRYHY
jgi:toxin YoeB